MESVLIGEGQRFVMLLKEKNIVAL